jgi:hypothetical protein
VNRDRFNAQSIARIKEYIKEINATEVGAGAHMVDRCYLDGMKLMAAHISRLMDGRRYRRKN